MPIGTASRLFEKEEVMEISDLLRRCVRGGPSISFIARETGIPQATLQEFAAGLPDGSYADLRLSSAQKLIDYFGLDSALRNVEITNKGVKRMRLAQELNVCNCSDSQEKFEMRLIDCLMDSFPNKTIDDMVCEPRNSILFCHTIRNQVASEALHDAIILKTLMNIRKRKNCPTGLKTIRKRKTLKKKLQEIGCDIPAMEFRELVVDCFGSMYKSITIDEIVCHPREALALCNFVRMKSGNEDLPDKLILQTLMNIRKAGGY